MAGPSLPRIGTRVRSQKLRPRSKQTNGGRARRRRSLQPSNSRKDCLMNKLNTRLLGIAALLLASFSWGGMFLLSKGVLAQVGPAWFTLIRYAISALVLLPLLLALRGPEPWRKLRARAAALSLRGFAGFGLFS